MSLLALFGLFRAAKFWVAAVMAVVQFIQVYAGVDFGLDEGTVTAILGGVSALLVWLIPNKREKEVVYADKSTFPNPPKGLY